MTHKTVALETLGCKLNQAETELLAEQFIKAGFTVVEASKPSDVWILNTCTVTHIADRKSRHLIRMARRQNPRALLVVTGCYAERAPQDLVKLEELDFLVSQREKPRLVELVQDRLQMSSTLRMFHLPGPGSEGFNTRAMIKIQDGCSSYCSYCIVPFVRGEEKSIPPDEILRIINTRMDAGYKEVVVTGTKLGAYKSGNSGLLHLVERILAETGVTRLRLSSLRPADLTPAFVSLFSDSRLCPHIHMPLQSGSAAVLERMRRDYRINQFEAAAGLARQMIPDVAITTDLIVGFPGESDSEFEESYRFCEKMAFAAIHVFPYSVRPSTRAAEMPQTVPPKIKRDRLEQMLALSRQLSEKYRQRFLGATMNVLWENKNDSTWQGLTGNYIRVKAGSDLDLGNQLKPAKLVSLCSGGMRGTLKRDVP